GGRRGARLAVEDRHLAEELAGAKDREVLLLAADLLGDPHRAGLDHEHHLARLALAKEDLARLELTAEADEHRVGHRAGESTAVRVRGAKSAGEKAKGPANRFASPLDAGLPGRVMRPERQRRRDSHVEVAH